MSKLYPLSDQQHPAVDPGEVVWLSASAGTGKTQVLSARVLRLLLQPDVRPEQILCLTFTKAGATEMASRINEVLARWVRADAVALAGDLKAIGADYGPESQARARRLFAEVLDCPGGGLRIDTIHAFSQWLLSAFPAEAGLLPGVKAMEDRERDDLAREVLSELLLEADRSNDVSTLGALELLSVRMGPQAVPGWLLRCAKAREAWEGPAGWQPPMRPGVLRLLGLPSDASHDDLLDLCSDGVFDTDALECCLSAYRAWNTASGAKISGPIAAWLEESPEGRLAGIDGLYDALFNKDEVPKYLKNVLKFEESLSEAADAVLACCKAVRERRAMLELADFLAPALEVGRKFSLAWDDAKARAGFIDFDDQIRQAAALLGRSELADWIRYKLDRRFDHILVDEAQDTNEAQWDIFFALIDDFFSGEGAHGDKLRTAFVVGDYKQAIFRFQGTSPENFAKAKERVRRQMLAVAENALALRDNRPARQLQDLDLGKSYRTAHEILAFVDRAIGEIGQDGLGLDKPAEPHVGQERPGRVVFWRVLGGASDEDGEPGETADEGEEGWLSRSDRKLADTIARQVRDWMDHGFPLVKEKNGQTLRRATPGDVMVLVRKRKELAGLIVARLYARGVPVAGVDRLRLGAPLAVRDLMAALRFAAQPYDDLNLACLLVSPLIGWSQEDLLRFGWRPDGVALFDHLRNSRGEAEVDRVWAQLGELLRIADYDPPQALLHWILTGPWLGRRKLVARMGAEANDPIDELLNAANTFSVNEVPSLNTFIHWFDAGDGELKREAGKARDEVRVMTVHGSKGLQAPIVILADAADDPRALRGSALELKDELSGKTIPLPSLRKDEQGGPILPAKEAAEMAEMQEHWRLLYVAMTRAEEALFIGGALSGKAKEPKPDSWYARLEPLFDGDWQEDPIWGAVKVHGTVTGDTAPPKQADGGHLPLSPPWLDRPVAAEPRPPRPLAPSSLGEELASDPPYPPGTGSVAARRGVLLHRLLERLPEVEPSARKIAAQTWLAKSATELDAPAREELAAAAIRVLEHKGWTELFAPGALAEVPIAATVGGQVIAGTIDRLLIEGNRIRLVDFKTARRPPATLDDVPVAILRQMAAYAAALEATYPGRRVEAALLYTQVPMLLEIPAALLALHKQELPTT